MSETWMMNETRTASSDVKLVWTNVPGNVEVFYPPGGSFIFLNLEETSWTR